MDCDRHLDELVVGKVEIEVGGELLKSRDFSFLFFFFFRFCSFFEAGWCRLMCCFDKPAKTETWCKQEWPNRITSNFKLLELSGRAGNMRADE